MPSLSPRQLALSGAGAFLSLFLALYLPSHCASIYMDDSGETAVVCATLSTGHPPGYPLHSLLGHAFIRAFPLADAAIRLNLFAGLLGAAALSLLFVLLLRRLRDAGAAALGVAGAAVLLAAAGPVAWHNALGAKGSIYMLNNLLSAACLAVLAWEEGLSLARRRLFWLCFGLGLADHYMSQLVLVPAYAWLMAGEGVGPRWRRALRSLAHPAALLALPGLTLYLYLPLRSAQALALDWASVHSWRDFWFYVVRAQYAAGEGGRSLGVVARQLWHALKLCGREGAYVLPVLAVLGAWRSQGALKPLAQALALGLLASLASVTFYLNLSPARLDIMRPYLFPAYLCQAALAALGAAWLAQRLTAHRTGLAFAGALLAGGLGTAAARQPSLDLSQYHYALDTARSAMQALPRGAMLLATGDAIIFPLWYLQRLRGERTDLAVVGTAVLPMDWVRQDLARRHPSLRQPRLLRQVGAESIDELTRAYLEMNEGQRAMFSTFNQLEKGVYGWRLAPLGPVYQAVRDGDPARLGAWRREPAQARLAAASIRGFFKRPLDAHTAQMAVHDFAIHHNSLGTFVEERGDTPTALAQYRLAQAFDPQSVEFPYNEGNALHLMGRLEEATDAYKRALDVDAKYTNAWYNLGVTYYKQGKRDEARSAFQTLLSLDPSRQDVAQLMKQAGL